MQGPLAEVEKLFPNEEAKKAAVPQTTLVQLVGWLDSPEPHVRHKLTELVGDLARIEKNRKRFGRLVTIERLVEFLQSGSDSTTKKWAARALGNLAYDNAKNIMKIVRCEAVPSLIALLKEDDVELQRNAAGALANLASQAQEEEVNTALVGNGVVVPVLDLLRAESQSALYMACRVLLNLADNESNQVEIARAGGITALLSLLQATSYADVLCEAINGLTFLSENMSNAVQIAREGGLKTLLKLTLSHQEKDVQSAAFAFLVVLAQKEDMRIEFKTSGLLVDLLALIEAESIVERKAAIGLLSHLTLNEENMVFIFEHVHLFLGFLSHDDLELRLNATMIFANMARNEEHCRKLMEVGCVKPLIELVAATDHRIQHLAASAIRNLSIPAENKKKMVEQGALPPLINLLTSQNAHVMFAGVGAIKSLLVQAENRERFVADGGLHPLIALKDAIIINTGDEDVDTEAAKPKDRRVQLEAGRVLALLSEDEPARDAIIKEGGLGLLVYMLESHFDILHFEAMKGLKNLAETEAHREVIVREGILEPLVSLITRSETPKVQVAALALICALAGDPKCHPALLQTGLLGILDTVAKRGDVVKELLEMTEHLTAVLKK